jgi:hypothetical protein
VGESWFNRLRFVSIEDNEVVRISGDWGPAFTQGSPTSDGEAAYFVERGGNHYIHLLERANGWSPIRITKAGYPQFSGEIHSSAFRGDDRYLYMRDSHGNFGRVDLENTANDFPVEMLMINVNGNYSEGRTILCYSKFSDCFYVTSPADQGIYKIWEDTSSGEWKIERYAGFNGSGYAEGDRLADAKFNYPTGICADNMGNVYVTNESNGTIFKIWLKDGRVEHVAGKEHGWIERPVIVGKPLDSQFKDPSSIVMDQEENFFITSLNGHEIHKYSIE